MQEIDVDIEKKEILKSYRELLRFAKGNIQQDGKKLIRKAFDFALEAHKDMRRKSGEPYIYHPLSVAKIVTKEIGLGTTSIVCALLHDVVEDTDYSLEYIGKHFGEKVSKIIDGLTKISEIFDHTSSIQIENFKKILLTLSDDVRVILIKLADRLHNMRTLDALPQPKQLKIASETLYLYAPLAHRLGLYALKSELEDLALKYLEPEYYHSINEKIESTQKERNQFIKSFSKPIEEALEESDINYRIQGRTKSIYSIYEKMEKKKIPFEEVFDLLAIRIIVDTEKGMEKATCYKVYSIVTDFYTAVPQRFRDWISNPKANGYESLHITVMSKTGKFVEVQIRSERMNDIAEKGYAAHWKYKESSQKAESGLDEWLNRIREILENPESNALDFIDDFKLNLFSEEIFVFTPKGEIKTLPVGATALDFAYNIHTQVGDTCIGAKVNHKLVPISRELVSGDQVEIINSSKQKPKENWLKFVITAKAKSKIKIALKEEKKEHAEEGKEILERKFKQLKINFNGENIRKLQQYSNSPTVLDLYSDVKLGKIGLKQIKQFLQDNERGKWLSFIKNRFSKSKSLNDKESEKQEQFLIKNKDSLIVGDESIDYDYSLAQCCNPIPGDEIFGFITINEGVKIHKKNCPNAVQLRSKYAYRVLPARWSEKEISGYYTGLYLEGMDRVGIVNKITSLISENLNLNIRSINFTTEHQTFKGNIKVYIQDVSLLNDLMKDIKSIEGITIVKRIDV